MARTFSVCSTQAHYNFCKIQDKELCLESHTLLLIVCEYQRFKLSYWFIMEKKKINIILLPGPMPDMNNLEGQFCIQGSEILSVLYQNMMIGNGWSLVTTPSAFLLLLSLTQFSRPLHIHMWLCQAYTWVLSISQGDSCSLIWDLGHTEQDTDCPRESRPQEPLTDASLGL